MDTTTITNKLHIDGKELDEWNQMGDSDKQYWIGRAAEVSELYNNGSSVSLREVQSVDFLA